MVIGNSVKLIVPVISGIIIDSRYNKDNNELEHLVEFTNEIGECHTRWFISSQLELK